MLLDLDNSLSNQVGAGLGVAAPLFQDLGLGERGISAGSTQIPRYYNTPSPHPSFLDSSTLNSQLSLLSPPLKQLRSYNALASSQKTRIPARGRYRVAHVRCSSHLSVSKLALSAQSLGFQKETPRERKSVVQIGSKSCL